MEWILAKMVSGFSGIEHLADWAVTNPGAAMFFGALLYALLNTIVKLSPTKYDDIVVDVLAKSLKEAYQKAFSKKVK